MRLTHSLTKLLVLLAVAATPALAQVELVLSYDSKVKPNVVVPKLAFAWGDSIRAIIQRDLANGDRIEVMQRTDSMVAPRMEADYTQYQAIGALFVVQIDQMLNGIRVSLHEVRAKKIAGTKDFVISSAANSSDWRFAVHGVSDQVQQWITKEPGIAQTRVAFVRGGALWVIDSDGVGERIVQRPAQGMILSPAWHPTLPTLAFSERVGSAWKIGLKSIAGGDVRWLTNDTDGANISPVFSPNGNELYYARQDNDDGNIWVLTLATLFKRGITKSQSGISSPTLGANGTKVLYVDDKLGNPSLFVMGSDGAGSIPFIPYARAQKTYLEAPSWSPDGSFVAYQARRGTENVYSIEVMDVRSKDPRAVTSTANNEDPSWGPDSQHIVFVSNRSGTSQLHVLDTKSGRSRQLTHGASSGISSPAWSPRPPGQ